MMINTKKDRSSKEHIDHIDLNENMPGSMDERASQKIAVRRKIDTYIEKKRLRDELFDD